MNYDCSLFNCFLHALPDLLAQQSDYSRKKKPSTGLVAAAPVAEVPAAPAPTAAKPKAKTPTVHALIPLPPRELNAGQALMRQQMFDLAAQLGYACQDR